MRRPGRSAGGRVAPAYHSPAAYRCGSWGPAWAYGTLRSAAGRWRDLESGDDPEPQRPGSAALRGPKRRPIAPSFAFTWRTWVHADRRAHHPNHPLFLPRGRALGLGTAKPISRQLVSVVGDRGGNNGAVLNILGRNDRVGPEMIKPLALSRT